jgi:hypothetical protein
MNRAQPPQEAPETGRGAAPGQAAPARRTAPAHGFGLEHGAAVLLRLGFIIIGALVVTAGLLYWRLSEGPLSLRILTPQLEAALSPSDGAFTVAIADTIVALDEEEKTIEVVARDVRLVDRGGRGIARVPEVALALSLPAAAHFMVAPTRLVAREPKLRLLRDAEGSFRLVGETGGGGDGESLRIFLEELAHPPDLTRPSGYLKEVALTGGTVEVEDLRLGRTWRAEGLDIRALRGETGLDGHIGAAVTIGDAVAELNGAFQYETESHRLVARVGADGIRPASLAGLAPALAPLAALDASVGGRARITVDVDRARVEASRLDLRVGPGRIVRPELPGGGVIFAGGRLSADYDPLAARLVVERMQLDLGGPSLEATGTIDQLHLDPGLGENREPLVVAVEAVARDLPAAELDRLWPRNAARGGREWVTDNIREGIVEEARANVKLSVRPDDLEASSLEAFSGTMRYRDLVLNYLRPLPPVTRVAGTAVFDRTKLELTPTTGRLLGIAVTGGLIRAYDLDTDEEKLAIDVAIEGPLRDAMTVIDSKPFFYAREIGIDPAKVTGDAAGKMRFRFPLVHDLKFAQVDLGVTANLSNVGVRQLVFDNDATEGVLDLTLDRNGLKLQGGAKLGEVPAALSLAHSFKPDRNGVSTRYTVWSVVDNAGRKRLDLDFLPDLIDGPIAVDASITEQTGKRRQVALRLGLKDARLTEALVGYEKAAGDPATARMTVDLQDDRPLQIRDLEAKGSNLDLKGAIGFTGKELARVDFGRLHAGQTDLQGSVVRRPEGGWRVDATGAAWDGAMLLAAKDDTSETPPVIVDARVERVMLGRGREARDVAVQLYNDGKHYEMARIDAAVGQKGKLTLRFGQAAGTRDFHLSTDDFGATLKLMDINDNIVGGRLSVDGRAEDVGPRRVLRGRAEGADYRLINAPVFAKLLSVASLPTMASLLAGEGIPFTRLTGGFELTQEKLVLDKARAYGGAIGINASGTIDRVHDTIDLAGTLVPAYTINSILGKIPVLGPLLLGGEGQGLFAANFRAVGPASNPTITVNPLSALAPGFLRNLFLFDVPSGEAAQEPTPPSPQVKDQ